jgi:hypothetical protein
VQFPELAFSLPLICDRASGETVALESPKGLYSP